MTSKYFRLDNTNRCGIRKLSIMFPVWLTRNAKYIAHVDDRIAGPNVLCARIGISKDVAGIHLSLTYGWVV